MKSHRLHHKDILANYILFSHVTSLLYLIIHCSKYTEILPIHKTNSSSPLTVLEQHFCKKPTHHITENYLVFFKYGNCNNDVRREREGNVSRME